MQPHKLGAVEAEAFLDIAELSPLDPTIAVGARHDRAKLREITGGIYG